MRGKVDMKRYIKSATTNNIFTKEQRIRLFGEDPQGEVVIPDGYTKIDNAAFFMCTGITSLRLPVSVKRLGRAAFWGCRNLTDAWFSRGLNKTSLDDEVFFNTDISSEIDDYIYEVPRKYKDSDKLLYHVYEGLDVLGYFELKNDYKDNYEGDGKYSYTVEYYTNLEARNRSPIVYLDEVEENYNTDVINFDSDLEAIQYAIYDIVGNDYSEINTVEDGIDFLDSMDLGMGYPIICKITGPNGVIYDSGMNLDTFLEGAVEYREDGE